MDLYCDSWDWQKCPYAVDISEAYRRYEEGDEMALIEQELKAQKKEIESLLRKLGRANKNIDKLKAKNQDLESQKRIFYEKWRKTDEQLREYEKKGADELGAMAGIYEQRMAYLIDSYAADGRLYEQEIENWAGDRAFAIVGDEDGAGRFWKVVFQEEETEDVPEKIEEQVQE
jgi:chromosome segregation ATPase